MIPEEVAGPELDPVLLRFHDDKTEHRFRAEHARRAARASRLAISAGAPGYLLLVLIIDEPGARAVAAAMLGVLACWVALSWTPAYARAYDAITVTAVAVLLALSMVMLFRLPPASTIIVAIALLTLNYMWIFVFLRPRFPVALAVGVGYLAALVVGGSQLWERHGGGRAPEGMVPLLDGRGGGALIVLLYAGFLLVLTASVAYRLERAERIDFVLREQLAEAHERSERLLANILPDPIAARLKLGHNPIVDDCSAVSVVFADIVGFTERAQILEPPEVLAVLDEVFTRFDVIAERHGLEKIKTIGDAYMAVAGAPEPHGDHAAAAAEMALDMLETVGEIRWPDGAAVAARVGIGSGRAVAGVIGARKFIYDLWGDTVNTASRMESHGIPGTVQVSDATAALLAGRYVLEDRGLIEVKGKGQLRTWLLAGRC